MKQNIQIAVASTAWGMLMNSLVNEIAITTTHVNESAWRTPEQICTKDMSHEQNSDWGFVIQVSKSSRIFSPHDFMKHAWVWQSMRTYDACFPEFLLFNCKIKSEISQVVSSWILECFSRIYFFTPISKRKARRRGTRFTVSHHISPRKFLWHKPSLFNLTLLAIRTSVQIYVL